MAGELWSFKDQGEDVVYEKMQETAGKMIDIFGKENFVGEIQWNAIPEQHMLNHLVIQLCKDNDLKIISTADCHYPKKEDWQYRELYRRLGLAEAWRRSFWRYPCFT